MNETIDDAASVLFVLFFVVYAVASCSGGS